MGDADVDRDPKRFSHRIAWLKSVSPLFVVPAAGTPLLGEDPRVWFLSVTFFGTLLCCATCWMDVSWRQHADVMMTTTTILFGIGAVWMSAGAGSSGIMSLLHDADIDAGFPWIWMSGTVGLQGWSAFEVHLVEFAADLTVAAALFAGFCWAPFFGRRTAGQARRIHLGVLVFLAIAGVVLTVRLNPI